VHDRDLVLDDDVLDLSKFVFPNASHAIDLEMISFLPLKMLTSLCLLLSQL
jgi:hypothetical protein